MERFKFKINVPTNVGFINKTLKFYGFECYLVGGCVRDALLNIKPKDFDLVTNAIPDKVIEILKHQSYVTSILETGKSFGVVNVITTDGEYEIATMRSDGKYSDGRRPDSVVFGDMESDAKRRDISFNALFYDIDTQDIVDLVGGVNDLKNGVVRTVGSPEERFGEDRLRILRAVRFAGRFGSDLDPQTDAALNRDANLEGISGERIRDEFIKGITSAKNVRHFLHLIDKYHLFDWIFKGLKINRDFLDTSDPVIVIAGLLRDNNAGVIGKALNNLKYTIEEARAIVFLINLLRLTPDNAVQLKRMEKNSGLSSSQIAFFGGHEHIDPKLLTAFLKFKLTVNGDELMRQLNLQPGKEVGVAIDKAEHENFLKLLK